MFRRRENSDGELCEKLTWRHHTLNTNKKNPTRNKKHRKENPKRLVTIQYDAGFLLFQLQYSADHEDWETVENATSWSHKASNSPFCIEVQLQLVILKCHRKHNKSIKPGEKQGSFLNWSPSIPSLPTYSKFPTPISHIRHLKLIS